MMDQVKERIVKFVRDQRRPVSVEEIAAALLLPPDEVYRGALLFVQEHRLVTVEEARELELTPA